MPPRGILLVALLIVSSAQAFLQSSTTPDSLTARIEGPAQFTQTGQPETFNVYLENSGSTAVSGTVRVQGIDGWQCEPDGRMPFSVSPKSASRVRFKVTPTPGSFNAFYPIHAFVEFDSRNGPLTAHPILLEAVS